MEPNALRPTQRILADIARHEWNKLLRALPPTIAVRAREIQVIFTGRPGPALRADGIETDCLGLFTGIALDEPGCTDSIHPPEMFLFLTNLWNCAEGNKAAFRAEVCRTLLHELGHYLGFEEDDLEKRGMD